MNCSICHRPHVAKKLPFLCAVDARNRLYEGRFAVTQAVCESEEAERLAQRVVDAPAELKLAEQDARDRTTQIIEQADRLRAEVDAATKGIAARKDAISRRKSDLASVSSGVSARRSRQLEETQTKSQRFKYSWNRTAETMAGTRAFLCEEAARLYGLRQVKKGNAKRYEIGGVEIVELHAMNNVSPEIVSTSLAHVAHILVLTSHYLAIQLPAEITLPHHDYPRPTIFSLGSSYRHGEIAFPGSGDGPQTPSGASAGRDGHVPRPRPLFIDKPLATIAKEDPSAYSLFLEGVALLAYNIAWACCTQGVSFGDKDSYEDISNMGQNLWRLLIGDQVHRRSVEPTFPVTLNPSGSSPKGAESSDMAQPKTMIGRWSHGTAHSFLGDPQGVELTRNFKILPVLKLVDRLKKRLSSEAPMLEWETIEGHEIEDGLEDEVLVGGQNDRSRVGAGSESIMTVGTVSTRNGASEPGRSTRGSGVSGWTKLKTRQ